MRPLGRIQHRFPLIILQAAPNIVVHNSEVNFMTLFRRLIRHIQLMTTMVRIFTNKIPISSMTQAVTKLVDIFVISTLASNGQMLGPQLPVTLRVDTTVNTFGVNHYPSHHQVALNYGALLVVVQTCTILDQQK